MLKKAVIENLVPEDKRDMIADGKRVEKQHQISYTTILPEVSGQYEDLCKRIDKLEIAVKQIIELLSNDHVLSSLRSIPD